MFFPIGDSKIQKGYAPIFTFLLLAANIGIFVYQLQLPPVQQEAFSRQFACVPADILQGRNWLSLITSVFLHGGWMHLAGNMLFLYVFADNVEAILGPFRFLLFYTLGGIVASLTHVITHLYSLTPCVGASGAIAACMGAYLVMFPGSKIKILFLLFLSTFQVRALFFLGLWIVLQLRSQWISSEAGMISDIAYLAHIGGFVFGMISGLLYRQRVYQGRDGLFRRK
ncbi:MAG: hypothetical protein RIQ62_1466 [Bacteroidota bacterium]|jgi:membrane associated rhomboid family serine protease